MSKTGLSGDSIVPEGVPMTSLMPKQGLSGNELLKTVSKTLAPVYARILPTLPEGSIVVRLTDISAPSLDPDEADLELNYEVLYVLLSHMPSFTPTKPSLVLIQMATDRLLSGARNCAHVQPDECIYLDVCHCH